MFLRYIALATCCLLTIAFLGVFLGNPQLVGLVILSKEFQFPAWLILTTSLVVGLLTGLSAGQVIGHNGKRDQNKLTWEAQDAKLIASVKSDREKLLESKIATLETALKQALKKL